MTITTSGRFLPAAFLCVAASAAAVEIENLSVTAIPSVQEANGTSYSVRGVSQNGRYAVFDSAANNLVAGDTNRKIDTFFYDAQSDTLERINLGAGGVQANEGGTGEIAVSDDGRYVIFNSRAGNLVAGVNQGRPQIFLRDRTLGTTQLLSRDAQGQPLAAAIGLSGASADGRFVLLATDLALQPEDTNQRYDLYRLDRNNGEYTLVTADADGRAGNRDTTTGRLSGDGRHAVFVTAASNLVAGDSSDTYDLFQRDIDAGTTLLVSRTTTGQFPTGFRTPLLASGRTQSVDGRFVVFNIGAALDPADTNNSSDGYLFDRNSQSVRRITLSASGAQLGYAQVASISADGSSATFHSQSEVLPGQTFGFNRSYRLMLAGGAMEQILVREPGYGDETSDCHLAGDGNAAYCRFHSDSWFDSAHNSFYNIYRADLLQAQARRVSKPLPQSVAVSNQDSGNYSISASADGRFVVFDSLATNLVVGDFNNLRDLFLRDRLSGTTTRINLLPNGGESFCNVGESKISADGRYVAFTSCSALVTGAPASNIYQVLRYDRVSGTTALVSANAQGDVADDVVWLSDISANGDAVAFYSTADNLLPVTASPGGDGFVRDMTAGTLQLVTRRSGGANEGSGSFPLLSADGRHVLFDRTAADLVDGDTNSVSDVFQFDRTTAQFERVSVDAASGQLAQPSYAHGFSANGRYALFQTTAAIVPDVPRGYYVRDRITGELDLVSRNNAGEPIEYSGYQASLSADAALVSMRCRCEASSSGPAEQEFNEQPYVFDRRTRHLQRIVPADANERADRVGLMGNDLLVFSSRASNLGADEGNNRFLDAFLATRFADQLFADGFDTNQ